MNEQFAIQGFSVGGQTLCSVEGDSIYQSNYLTGQKQLIGKTIEAYNELEATTTEYYNKLVEMGVIVPPQDPEQKMEQMQQTMLEMSQIIKSLADEIKELKKNEPERNPGSSEQDVSQRGPEKRGRKGTDSAAGDA